MRVVKGLCRATQCDQVGSRNYYASGSIFFAERRFLSQWKTGARLRTRATLGHEMQPGDAWHMRALPGGHLLQSLPL